MDEEEIDKVTQQKLWDIQQANGKICELASDHKLWVLYFLLHNFEMINCTQWGF